MAMVGGTEWIIDYSPSRYKVVTTTFSPEEIKLMILQHCGIHICDATVGGVLQTMTSYF